MAGGPTITVRQVASYPLLQSVGQSELVLVQQGGLGGPYAAISPANLVATALAAGPALGVGENPPADADGNSIFCDENVFPDAGRLLWNAYVDGQGTFRQWLPGTPGGIAYSGAGGFGFSVAGSQALGQPLAGWSDLMRLSPAGALSLPHGTLAVARDPGSAMEVATMRWVGNQTVASFNGRRGVVTLNAADIYGALGICPPDCIATTSSVNQAICAAINDALRMHPGVWSWMGRVGDVFLTVADMNFAAANNPSFMPPLTIPTPPSTVSDGEVVTAAWVIEYLTSTSGFATQAWVTNYVAQNTVNSFNGRLGTVTLTLADITGAGGAPIASPSFSGIPTVPTAAPNTSTGQIASTAFVMAAVTGATAGVASFNGRTGAVVLNTTDITNAGGAPSNSPALTGLPTAPTPAAGNSSTQIATTAFVAAAVAGTPAVNSFNGRTGAVTLTLGDVTGVGGAPIASPAFTGTPTGPTAAAGTNNTELATTAFVTAAITAIGPGVTSFEGRTGAVTLQANDISAAGGLINPSVALTGTPTAPTAAAGNSSTQIATTAFVGAALLAGAVTTFNGRNGAVTLAGSDITGAGGALLASPTFTGTPAGPTAAPGTNTTQLATTAFVTGALATQAANSVTSFNGRQGVVTLTTADITGAGGAPIASPTFTGTPSVPTATAGTSTTQAASTAFVMNAIAASTAGVTSFNSRTGAVTLQTNDVSAVGGALLASPTFTGTPTAPTPTAGDNSTNIATTAFVSHALSTAAVQSFNGRTGVVTLQLSDVTGVGGAPLASPAFTGTPTAPTPAAADNSTNIATTAYVRGGFLPLTGGSLTGTLTIAGTAPNSNLNVRNGNIFFSAGAGNGATMFFGGPADGSGALAALSVNGAGTQVGIANGAGGTLSLINLNANAVFLGNGPSPGTLIAMSGQGVQYVALGATQSTAIWWTGSQAIMATNGVNLGALQFQSSDAALKENFAPIAVDPLGTLNQVRLQQFDWIPNPVFTVQRPHWNCGFTAQDIGSLIPEAQTGEAGNLGVDTLPLVAYCIGAIQKLVQMIEQLQAAVGALQTNANVTPTAWLPV